MRPRRRLFWDRHLPRPGDQDRRQHACRHGVLQHAVAGFAGGGVQGYLPTTGFVPLNTNDASAVATDGNGNVVAEFPGQGVLRYQSGVGWTPLTASYASLLAMNASGDVVAEFPGAASGAI